jgi:hypothetical protein
MHSDDDEYLTVEEVIDRVDGLDLDDLDEEDTCSTDEMRERLDF